MTDQTQTTVNTPLLAKVLDHIVAHPAEWEQGTWATHAACGTTYCLAGWTVVLGGLDVEWREMGHGWDGTSYAMSVADGRSIEDAATELLRIPRQPASDPEWDLYSGFNRLRDLYRISNHLTGGEIAIPDELPDGS